MSIVLDGIEVGTPGGKLLPLPLAGEGRGYGVDTSLSLNPRAIPWKHCKPRCMVMGPGGLAFLAPFHPPRRAMIHAAQGSDFGGKGFLSRSVFPSTVGAMASSTSMSLARKAAVAGRWSAPPR